MIATFYSMIETQYTTDKNLELRGSSMVSLSRVPNKD